ncbi:MAG: alpha/beta hydrolase [Candidatus Eremiobacteraeota bacterium]|nr:alpha/beta hydrolase [Candidatus Eremiobacteraeota bacterium]
MSVPTVNGHTVRAPDPAEARRRLDAIAERERAEPELNPASSTRWWLQKGVAGTAVVLLHGITNTPQQYAALAPQLHADGHSVIAPRFPYHGYRDRLTSAVARLTIEDLLARSLEAIVTASLLAWRVEVLGISVGATVAAWLGLRVSLDNVIAVAPFFGIMYFPGSVSDALGWAFHRLPNTFVWWDPIRRDRQLPLHAYPRFPTRGLASALRLASGFKGAPLGQQHTRRFTLVFNSHEPIVNNRVASSRVTAAAGREVPVQTVVLTGLPYQHDIIEPTVPHARTDLVYPVLRELVAARTAARA